MITTPVDSSRHGDIHHQPDRSLRDHPRKHWGSFSPTDHDNAYFATYAMSEIANYLWGALPNKTSELNDEMIMQLAQTLRYLGLTIATLPPDVPFEGAESAMKWSYDPPLHYHLGEAAELIMRAGRALEKVRDFLHGITDEPSDTERPEPASSANPTPLTLATTPAIAVTPLVSDCREVFNALGVDQLPSRALSVALARMFPQRWAGMTRATLPGRLPDEIRPRSYTSTKSLYLRADFYPAGTDEHTATQPGFLTLLAGAFTGRTEDAVPVGWLHDHWITHRPAGGHLSITEFCELLRIHGATPDWTRSGHFIRRNQLPAATQPSHEDQPQQATETDEPGQQEAS